MSVTVTSAKVPLESASVSTTYSVRLAYIVATGVEPKIGVAVPVAVLLAVV